MRKRGQATQVFKYLFVAFIVLAISVAGFRAISSINQKACDAALAEFQIELSDMEQSLRTGAVDIREFSIPCDASKLILLDTSGGFPDVDAFGAQPIIQDSIRSESEENAFLLREEEILDSFDAGNLDLPYPDSLCLLPGFGKVELKVERKGPGVRLTPVCEQRVCGSYTESFERQKTRDVIDQGNRFSESGETCYGCPRNPPQDMLGAEAAMEHLIIERGFTFCDGSTQVQLTLTPKDGAAFRNLALLESISGECTPNLQRDLTSVDDTTADRTSTYNGEPMIVWLFGEFDEPVEVTYSLKGDLSDQCRQTISGAAFTNQGNIIT